MECIFFQHNLSFINDIVLSLHLDFKINSNVTNFDLFLNANLNHLHLNKMK